ncbi:ABC transporter ATP-binding protein [Micrococcus flavus]|uniref:Manganese transport system ATP-binding protein n=1 Tax=Micrococcus flavus TaxID=384602 RepID=A0A4Y8X552_9MICC|nr:ABC transporter ATP-binding protein [Micrococcus flavus]MBB4883060.1 manganese transport system ATP-binding protein [Micrococcus flavus]TFI04475.1 ABC transporter ATP-binding protein [Micrococcus flavus]GGK42114.1 ABC transporter ATP-binding protein [Micrococcus flavus]
MTSRPAPPAEPRTGGPGAAPLAEARGLELRRGTHLAVAASDLTLPAGRLVAVIGPNGSGKSTLLHALAGTLPPSAGTLTVRGESPARHARRTAFVMQTVEVPRGVPLTVRDVVTMGRYPSTGWFRRMRAADRAAVQAAMDRMDVTDLAGRHLDELSGGQRQRAYVAQGIAQEHDVLLLDEPVTGLDLVSARTIDHLLHEEPERGVSVVYTTHDLDEAAAADHVVLMAGRVVASGTPAEVLTEAHLETAYGRGALHRPATPSAGAAVPFLDDPVDGAGRR